jgi:hypothetical protein
VNQNRPNFGEKELDMAHLETLMMKLDDSLQKFNDDDLVAVFAMVPWARESIHTYLLIHNVEVEKPVLERMEALLASAT